MRFIRWFLIIVPRPVGYVWIILGLILMFTSFIRFRSDPPYSSSVAWLFRAWDLLMIFMGIIVIRRPR